MATSHVIGIPEIFTFYSVVKEVWPLKETGWALPSCRRMRGCNNGSESEAASRKTVAARRKKIKRGTLEPRSKGKIGGVILPMIDWK